MKDLRLENFLSIFGRQGHWAVLYELWSAGRPLSVRELMKRIGCSEHAVRRAARRLSAMAMISRQFTVRHRGVEYTLNLGGEHARLLGAVCKLFEAFP